jgi:16S rRNA processing protein RimM
MSPHSGKLKQETKPSGSPQSGEPVYVTIGKLRRPHGLNGEVIMEMITDFPEKIKAGMKIFVGKGRKEYILSSIRPTDKLFLVSFEGFKDCDSVSIFRNQWVFVESSTLGPLPEGRFYQHEVVGMQVFDETGNPVGIVKEILVTGANDVYVISKTSGEDLLLPAIKQVIRSMNRETHCMVVHLQEWD